MNNTFFALGFLTVLMLAGLVSALFRSKSSVLERLDETTEAVSVVEEAAWMRLTKWKNPLTGIANRLAMQGDEMETLGGKIRAAGLSQRLTVQSFISLKLLMGLGGFVFFAVIGAFGLGMTSIGMGFLLGGLGYMAPEIWLTSLVASRKAKIEKGLLNFIAMLAVTCEAGLTLGEAMARVAQELGGQIGDEVDRILTEAKMGGVRSKAMKEAAARYDSADLSLVFGTIATAEEHGTPIVGVLKEVARQLRQARRNRAQEQAQKASVKILVPIILCMFVPLAIVVVGPPVMNLFRSLTM